MSINDLPHCLTQSTASMFADSDTNVTIEEKSVVEIENKLNIDLEKMHQGFLANKLILREKQNISSLTQNKNLQI